MARRRRRSRRNHGRKLVLAVLALLLAGLYPLKEQLLEDGGSSRAREMRQRRMYLLPLPAYSGMAPRWRCISWT